MLKNKTIDIRIQASLHEPNMIGPGGKTGGLCGYEYRSI